MLDDAVDESREALRVAKHALVDAIEDLGERGFELVVLVEVGVAEVLDVFGEIAEEEDVVLANLTGDFDLVEISYELRLMSMLDLRWHHRRYR